MIPFSLPVETFARHSAALWTHFESVLGPLSNKLQKMFELKQQMKKDEKAADHRHLTKYGADSDSMKKEIEGKARRKRDLAKAQMDAQKKVEDMKNRADQERRVSFCFVYCSCCCVAVCSIHVLSSELL